MKKSKESKRANLIALVARAFSFLSGESEMNLASSFSLMNRFLFAAAFTLATTWALSAEESTEESFIPNYSIGYIYGSYGGKSDVSGGPGSLQVNEFGFQGNVPVWNNDTLRLTAGLGYRLNQLDFGGAFPGLGTDSLNLYRVDIPFNAWWDLGSRWKFWGRLQPGWYSDFEHVSSDDFVLTSLALLSYQWSDQLKIAFGGYYSRDLGEERLLPAAGLIWEPNRHTSLALTFPRVELAYAPNEDWLFAGRAFLSGASWNIEDPLAAGNEFDLIYRSIRVGLGVEHRVTGPVWGYLDAGMQFGQDLEWKRAGLPEVDLELENSFYITSGIKVRF